MNITKQIKAYILVAIFLLVGALVWYLATNISSNTGRVEVALIKAPSDSNVVVDGKEVSGSTIYLSPGTHSYIISRNDFRSVAGTVEVKEGSVGNTITGILEPTTQVGEDIYSKSTQEYAVAESAAGAAAEARGEAEADENPIIGLLPYTNLLFTIGYRADPSDTTGKSIILEIDASPTYRDAAITQLSAWGYNPAEYKINFKGEENPFK
jgi:hypothetical protein